MSKKQVQITALEGWCVIEANIECGKCKKVVPLNPDAPGECAYNEGFRVVDDDVVLCKSCIRNSNKSKSQRRIK